MSDTTGPSPSQQAEPPARGASAAEILRRVDALPTLSPIATRLMRVAGAEDADLTEIVSLIESDPALTARVLGLCRRAELGLGDKITTVKWAVTMLGLEVVQSAVLAVHVYELLREQGQEMDRSRTQRGQTASAFDRDGLWRHAIAVACASELLASRVASLGARPDEAFVAGLLHDIGRLSLELALPEAYARVVRLAERRASDSAPVEREVLGLDHFTAGRHVAQRWGLPTGVEHVAWLHAQPIGSMPDTPARDLVGLVTLARAVCRRQRLGWSGDFGPDPDPEAIARELGVNPGVGDAITPTLVEAVASRCATLGLGEPTTPELLMESITRANDRLGALNETLARRSRQAARQGAALDAIAAFQASRPRGEGIGGALQRVASCAEGLLGAGFYATLCRPAPGHAWRITGYAAGARPTRERTADAPHDLDPRTLSPAALSWLAEHLDAGADLSRLSALDLSGPSPSGGDGPAAALLVGTDPAAAGFTPEVLRAVTAVWSAAIAEGARSESQRGLADRLAETNRALGEAQASLTARESMTRLGEMSAGAAHEMNNPLTIIRGRSQLLADRLEAPREKAAARAIAEASGRLAELITAMHALASPPRPNPERHDAMGLVDEAIEIAKKRVGGGASVRVTTETIVSPVFADREQIVTALAELITNALEASSGEIVELRVQTDPDDGRFVCRVVDRGPGLSDRAARHAFDPFFSEKAAGRQTGLGLARARRFAELHGGHVSLAANPEGGTIATLSIAPAPRRSQETDEPRRAAA